MRRTVKNLLKVFGILFIAFPFVASNIDRLPFPAITSFFSQPDNLSINATQQALQTGQKSPYSPSTYVAQARTLVENAHNASNPTQTADYLRDALAATNEGLIFYTDTAELYAVRGDIYTALQGSVDDANLFALHDYKEAFTLAPSETTYGKKAAGNAVASGEYDQAVQLLTQLHTALPQDPEVLLDLAQAQAKTGAIESAIASYSDVITLLSTGDTEAVRKERDTLIQLAAANLYDAPARNASSIADSGGTTSSAQTTLPTAIGGPSELFIPPANQTIPREVVLSDSTNNDNPYQSGTNNGMTGETILTAGHTRVSVSHTAVTADTPIYVTATSDTDNQTLYIANKKSGTFTVAIDESIANDISFKWWIVN